MLLARLEIEHYAKTTLQENSHWIMYRCEDGKKTLKSWLIVSDEASDEEIEQQISAHISKRGGVGKFPNINELQDFLMESIIACHNSDNEMLFVEQEDMGDLGRYNLADIEDCIGQHKLGEYLRLGEDGAFLTVYGGVSSVINWPDDCPLGGDVANDCADCFYSGDYYFYAGECIRREDS